METEEKVRTFYENKGWENSTNGLTTDAQLFEDLRSCAHDYVSECRRKILKYLPREGEYILDGASGPIQYPEYLDYSKNFKSRVCVDISEKALEQAKKKLGDHGQYVKASLLSLPFVDDYFDAVVSLHTIYHIEASQQEKAVRELLRVSKPGTSVIIIYSNPHRLLARASQLLGSKKNEQTGDLYFHCHPLEWWNRFRDQAHMKVVCWRSLTAKDAHRIIPDNRLGKSVLWGLLKVEKLFPRTLAAFGAYPMIVLKKR